MWSGGWLLVDDRIWINGMEFVKVMTGLNDLVNYCPLDSDKNEVTTINKLDQRGLIVFETWEETGRKINGERKSVIRYSAVLKETKTENGCESYTIGKFAYLSKTKQAAKILEVLEN